MMHKRENKIIINCENMNKNFKKVNAERLKNRKYKASVN